MTASDAFKISALHNAQLRVKEQLACLVAAVNRDVFTASHRGHTRIHPVINGPDFRQIVRDLRDHFESEGFTVDVPGISRSATSVAIIIDWSDPK